MRVARESVSASERARPRAPELRTPTHEAHPVSRIDDVLVDITGYVA